MKKRKLIKEKKKEGGNEKKLTLALLALLDNPVDGCQTELT